MFQKLTLFDLFAENNVAAISTQWPRSVQPISGFIANWPPPNFTVWLAGLNNGVDLSNVRMGAAGDRVSVEAQLQIDNARTSFPDGFPFVLAQMPDVEFRIQTITATNKFVQLFASGSERGAEVVLEGLPVEIRLPIGLVEPPNDAQPDPDDPTDPTGISVGSFTAGSLDDLKIIYRRDNSTSIFAHVRLSMNEDNDFTVRPSVPISFGKCKLSGIPCLAVHDFNLLPSPNVVQNDVEWIRHPVTPFIDTSDAAPKGLFAARSLHIDSKEAPFKDASDWLNRHADEEPTAEFVLDDVVVPFYSVYVIPIPRHITVGIRRRVVDPDSIKELFSFERAPIRAHFSRDPAIGLIVNSLFYKSLPSEDLSEDLGLTFSAAVIFGADEEPPPLTSPPTSPPTPPPQHGIELTLAENYTLRIAYLRDFGADGSPAPGTGAAAFINSLLHWEIAKTFIDIMAFRLGYSLGRAIGENRSFLDCAEATIDVFISAPPPDASDDSFFKLKALDGQQVKIMAEGIGWRQGSLHFEGLSSPDGVMAIFKLSKLELKLIIQEIALVAENGATYLSFTAGVAIAQPSSFEGSLVVKRMRFRVQGNESAPFFKLDGFFARFKTPTVEIEAGGYFTDKQDVATQTRVRELGLTGSVKFKISAIDYLFGLDVLVGGVESPTASFDYFMFQAFFRGSVVIAWFELRGVRFLFANNMQPKLAPVDRESHELRYYNWYKSSNPISVPGDRRLAAWQARDDSWAFGIGLGASIAGLGNVLELDVFVLFIFGNDENGFLIVGELLAFQHTDPVGYFALEWDGKNDRFSLVIGVKLTIKKFLKSAPDWLDNVARLTGTIFISNDPGTFAIGKLADERTWLTLRFDIDLWLTRTFILFGFCFEFVDRPSGPKGTGLVVRMEGSINAGIVRVSYNAGFGLLVVMFQTGSSDYAAVIFIEAGLRIVLFGFLRFGISARADFRSVGSKPSRGEVRFEIKLETPWFLPDVTWTFEIVFGDLQPQDLATSVSPLRIAAATEGLTKKNVSIHIERFDMTWNGEGPGPTHSVSELQAPAADEAQRLARFEANPNAHPIATDSTIAIEWSVAVNDKLALSGAVATNLGDQVSGDLTLKYDLVGISVRRRARFGSDRSWKLLEDRTELTADFSDPNGVSLTGAFGPQQLTKFWDPTVQISGQPGTKKLLFNSTTPFEFQTKNDELDEGLVKDNHSWPCCDEKKKRQISKKFHTVTFTKEPLGVDLTSPKLFSESQSRFIFLRPAYVRPRHFSAPVSNTPAAYIETVLPGPIFRSEFDDDVAFYYVSLAWPRAFNSSLSLRAYDVQGKVIGSKLISLAAGSGFQTIVLGAQGPIRRVDAAIIMGNTSIARAGFEQGINRLPVQIEIDGAAYLGLRDFIDYISQNEICGSDNDDFKKGFEGKGKLFFLPNHDYEIAITTRVTIAHPSKQPASGDVKEYAYFKTKGLPGLNAVNRVGEEVEPYAQSIYSGGRGILYREEPVALAFKEDFHIAVPLASRPPGTSDEHTTLLRMKLLAQPDTAINLETPFTATSTDWITAHRSSILTGTISVWTSAISASTTVAAPMISADPFRGRLATLTQRERSGCDLADPRNVVGPVLIAPPQGTTDPDDPARQLWPQSTRFTAAVRLEGAGYVDRRRFEDFDNTAFDCAIDTGPGDSAAWTVVEGELRAAARGARRFAIFGEPTWNHLAIQTGIKLGGQLAGVGVALPAGNVPSQGLFALIEQAGAGHNIAIYRRQSGVQFDKLTEAALPTPTDPAAAFVLNVTAYDDKLRISVGEVMIEVERGELREGQLCLLAQDAAQFTSLQIRGLDIYTFPFITSQFRSFKDHIESYEGKLDVMAANSLGPSTTTTTTAAFYSATQSDIQTAMQPSSDAVKRQAIFDQWVSALGLPLKDEITNLEISRFEAASQTEFFLIESPEPLDFTEEVKITLSRRVRQFIPPWIDPLDAAVSSRLLTEFDPSAMKTLRSSAGETKSLISDAERSARLTELRKNLRDELLSAAHVAGSDQTSVAPPASVTDLTANASLIQDIVRQTGGLRVEIDPASLPTEVASANQLIFAEAVESGSGRQLKFYLGKIAQQGSNRRAVINAEETDLLTVIHGNISSIVSRNLAELALGSIIAISPDLKGIIGRFQPSYIYVTVDTRIIQNGSGTQALLIPVSGSAATPLASGTYRMTWTIERKRWDTTAPPDDLNRFSETTSIRLTF